MSLFETNYGWQDILFDLMVFVGLGAIVAMLIALAVGAWRLIL